MVLLKFVSFLVLYTLTSFVGDYPVEGAIINKTNNACSLRDWRCDNGLCISFEKKCDGNIDCTDESDEDTKHCSANNFSTSKEMCILPQYPSHGQYTATNGLKPGDAVAFTSLTYSCDQGYTLQSKRSTSCFKGIWIDTKPTCERQCKPLRSTTVDFKCYKPYSNLEISCTLPQESYSRATAMCRDSYQSEPPPKDLICIKGSWDYMPYCTPECGTVALEEDKLSIGGDAKIGEVPWHVAVYMKSLQFYYICGGTIVSPTLVVTVAHCVYREPVGELYPASDFAVAAGKIYRRWSDRRDENYVQKTNVVKIEVPERYRGLRNEFMADIAVLILERSFVLSSFIRPVCIPSDSNDNLNGQLGKVAGWGLTAENGRSSKILQTVRLPFVSFQECYVNSPESFRPVITSDKICAGYTTGTALCKGDSGGGLVFSRWNGNQGIYYLYGITAAGPRNKELTSCDQFAYNAFTDLRKHHKWFQDIWSTHNVPQ